MSPTDIKALQDQLVQFARERDWEQFHSPKNLSMALAAEAGELLEVFQWLTESHSRQPDPVIRQRAGEELADIFLYTLMLCHRLDIELLPVAFAKLAANGEKYPVAKVRGSARKYTDY
ncbi:MAG: hypothetical protein RLZZ385_2145 [Pseudomonadota bacterium]